MTGNRRHNKSHRSNVMQERDGRIGLPLLRRAWDRVSSNPGAATPGTDGQSCADIAGHLETWLQKLARQLNTGTWQPGSIKTVQVPRRTGSTETRELGILDIRDRVVHTAVKFQLEPQLEQLFLRNSFGFRPGRSVPMAMRRATGFLDHPANQRPPLAFALKLDVADCFGSIDHELLINDLETQFGDCHSIRLVQRFLEPMGSTRGWWNRRRVGICQGSALSPLLCNLYLHPVDRLLCDLQKSSGGRIAGLRFADDLLILAADRSMAAFARRRLSGLLGHRRLSLKRDKQELKKVTKGPEWLGLEICPRAASKGWVRYGYLIPARKVTSITQRLVDLTTLPERRIQPAAFNPGPWIESVNEQLFAWKQAYDGAGNAHEVFHELDHLARERVGRLISTCTGLRGQPLYEKHLRWCGHRLWTWQIDGVRLKRLSTDG